MELLTNIFNHPLAIITGAFLMLGINEAIIKPNAIKVTKHGYRKIRPYIKETYDKLDAKLRESFSFVDEAILPEGLSQEEKDLLIAEILRGFSAQAHVNKTQSQQR